MNTPKSVSGVLGMCRVGFGYPTRIQALSYAGSRLVCGVCWVLRRVRACVKLLALETEARIFSYARAEKPDKPNTLNSKLVMVLILKGFVCVGFVLGYGFFVSGSVFRGKGR